LLEICRRFVKIDDRGEREVPMADKRCAKCAMLYEEEELLVTEDTGEAVCPDCSGLLAHEDLDCQYDENG
jgi:hypothetical protein